MTGDLFSVSPFLYLLIPIAFVLGSIPFGVLFTRSCGVDIRSTGSRNIGATNVLRSAGKKSALLTLLGDMIKGAVPVMAARYFMAMDTSAGPLELSSSVRDFWPGIIGLTAVLGHMFSAFLSFKGGKGVATGFGVILVYSPPVAGTVLVLWLAVALAFRYSALAALVAVTAMPFVLILFKASAVKISLGTILALLIIYRHKSNIKDLLRGTENKIGEKK